MYSLTHTDKNSLWWAKAGDLMNACNSTKNPTGCNGDKYTITLDFENKKGSCVFDTVKDEHCVMISTEMWNGIPECVVPFVCLHVGLEIEIRLVSVE